MNAITHKEINPHNSNTLAERLERGGASTARSASRKGRVSDDRDPAARPAMLNWLFGDLAQILNSDETVPVAGPHAF